MKTFSASQTILEVLSENGIDLICAPDMNLYVTPEQEKAIADCLGRLGIDQDWYFEDPYELELEDSVIVSDPSYYYGIMWQRRIDNLLPGTWHPSVERDAIGRVTALAIRHDDYQDLDLKVGDSDFSFASEVRGIYIAGGVSVDAGMVGFFPPEYYARYHQGPKPDEDWYQRLLERVKSHEYYSELPGPNPGMVGIDNEAVIAAVGDGDYTVYACMREGRVVGAKISFV